MKRFVVLFIAVCLLFGSAVAEDLQNLSLDQLRALVLQINAEIIGRAEWEGADVPAGQWIVGVDIPAGEYSISVADKKGAYLTVKDARGRLVINSGIRGESQKVGKVLLQDGFTVDIDGGVLHFGPPVSLSF